MYSARRRTQYAPTSPYSLAALALIYVVGCNAQPSRNPGVEVIPTKVQVNYQGGPIEGARVSFSSTESQRSAVGVTDAAGIAAMTTFDPNDGAIVGNHQVKISKDVMETVKEADPNDPTSAAMVRPKHLLPPRYGKFETSGLTADVATGENVLTFDLKD